MHQEGSCFAPTSPSLIYCMPSAQNLLSSISKSIYVQDYLSLPFTNSPNCVLCTFISYMVRLMYGIITSFSSALKLKLLLIFTYIIVIQHSQNQLIGSATKRRVLYCAVHRCGNCSISRQVMNTMRWKSMWFVLQY